MEFAFLEGRGHSDAVLLEGFSSSCIPSVAGAGGPVLIPQALQRAQTVTRVPPFWKAY